MEAAKRLRDGRPIEVELADIALDLAFAARRTDAALGIVDAHFTGYERLMRRKYVMKSLHYRCPSFAMERGSGFPGLSMPVYRFD